MILWFKLSGLLFTYMHKHCLILKAIFWWNSHWKFYSLLWTTNKASSFIGAYAEVLSLMLRSCCQWKSHETFFEILIDCFELCDQTSQPSSLSCTNVPSLMLTPCSRWKSRKFSVEILEPNKLAFCLVSFYFVHFFWSFLAIPIHLENVSKYIAWSGGVLNITVPNAQKWWGLFFQVFPEQADCGSLWQELVHCYFCVQRISFIRDTVSQSTRLHQLLQNLQDSFSIVYFDVGKAPQAVSLNTWSNSKTNNAIIFRVAIIAWYYLRYQIP